MYLLCFTHPVCKKKNISPNRIRSEDPSCIRRIWYTKQSVREALKICVVERMKPKLRGTLVMS